MRIKTVMNHNQNDGLLKMIRKPHDLPYPTNIQGTYAAYFAGDVYTTSSLTATGLYTIMDNELCDNIVSWSESKRSGKTTLENLLNMNIVEYNLKGQQKITGSVLLIIFLR